MVAPLRPLITPLMSTDCATLVTLSNTSNASGRAVKSARPAILVFVMAFSLNLFCVCRHGCFELRIHQEFHSGGKAVQLSHQTVHQGIEAPRLESDRGITPVTM